MSEAHESGWTRYVKWLRQQRDEAQTAVLAGSCAPDEYRGLCERAKAFGEAIDHAKLISTNQDIVPQKRDGPWVDIET